MSDSGQILPNGVVDFAEDGTVLDVRVNVPDIDSLPRAEYLNGILIPGMVNAHCHLELSFFKGEIPQGTGLVEFIKNVVSRRGSFARDLQIERAKAEDAYMWATGVQAVGDISNDTVSFDAKIGSKIHYHTFAEYFGTPTQEEANSKYLHDTEIVATARKLGLMITPTPHSTYLVSEELFSYANESERLSIHFMETPSEVDLFDRRGGMYDFMVAGGMAPDFLHYGGHSCRLVEQVDGGISTLLVHNTQIQKQDVERVLSHFRDVTFVLCPRSNYYIERGTPPAEMLHRMGCSMALGTDSLSSNTSLDMAAEVECLWRENPSLELSTILSWATIGGARGLGMDSVIGSLTCGKRPGAVLLEGLDLATMSLREGSPLTSRRIL